MPVWKYILALHPHGQRYWTFCSVLYPFGMTVSVLGLIARDAMAVSSALVVSASGMGMPRALGGCGLWAVGGGG